MKLEESGLYVHDKIRLKEITVTIFEFRSPKLRIWEPSEGKTTKLLIIHHIEKKAITEVY